MKKFMCIKGFWFNLFTGTFKRFCRNIPERLLREAHLSVTPVWNLMSEIVVIFLGRNTSNKKFLDVTNKETKKVIRHRCWSLSIMNLEQLIFTWKGRHLVLALFASIKHKWMVYSSQVFLVTGKYGSEKTRILTCFTQSLLG